MSMSNPADRVEIITSVQRRRRWAAAEKVRMVEETFEPGMTVSLVARRRVSIYVSARLGTIIGLPCDRQLGYSSALIVSSDLAKRARYVCRSFKSKAKF